MAGFAFISPVLQRRLGIYDSCGVHNLHGMPSILAAIASSIVWYVGCCACNAFSS